MHKFILELRRREVFRTAGLYVGVCWIVIEVSSVLLPTFEAPEWILRALIIAAMVGFPIMLVLAWVYDITAKGVVVQDEGPEASVDPVFSRKTDFVVIGVLSVALMLSLYFNFTQTGEPLAEPDPVSILIADFDNKTGNPLFDGTLEQALMIGIEGAPFITTYRRDDALKQAQDLDLGEKLDEEAARLVAVRQDVRMVLAGSIERDGDRFDLLLRAVDPITGEVITETEATAGDGAQVLGAMNNLTLDIREALGDTSTEIDEVVTSETLTATSLEAIKHYTTAQDLARVGRDEEAIEYYAMAIEEDPNFARAYSGWGLSANRLGRPSESEEQYQMALSLLDRMTPRERYRTLGLYYTQVSLNFGNAIDNYEQLVENFPADGAGNNNLAVLYTMTAQYDKALAQSEQLLKIYPGRVLYHLNHSQYAMFAGDIDTARKEAEYVLEQDPDYFKAYMVLAITELYAGNADAARGHYERMAETGERGQSLATAGLADIALFEGDPEGAIAILAEGIAVDEGRDDQRGAGTKRIAVARAQDALGNTDEALITVDAIENRRGDGQLVPSAVLFSKHGRFDDAFEIAESLRQQLRPTARAYASMIDGINAYHQQEYVLAINKLTEALEEADLWLVRYYLAHAYLEAEYPAEATAAFDACIERRGEAGTLFFDDVPTWHYTVGLEELRDRASKALSAPSVADNQP